MDILEPGMKVECINDAGTYGSCHPINAILKAGQQYTIATVYKGYARVDGYILGKDQCVVDIVGSEVHFAASRFRPIRNRETDIAIFHEIDAHVFKRVDA